MIEVVAGRMRHIWNEQSPDRIPLCGSWRNYAPHFRPSLATEEDKQKRHLCKKCERLAAND